MNILFKLLAISSLAAAAGKEDGVESCVANGEQNRDSTKKSVGMDLLQRHERRTTGRRPALLENKGLSSPSIMYQHYRLTVGVEGQPSAPLWCLEEIDFFDADGVEIATPAGHCFADTEYASALSCERAFDQPSDQIGGHLPYCSRLLVQTGSLGYSFAAPTAITSYAVRSSKEGTTPTAWVFEGSNDMNIWDILSTVTSTTITQGDGVQETFTLGAASPGCHQFLVSLNLSDQMRNSMDCDAIGSTHRELRQSDFDEGTLIIDTPGTYVLMEDIVFEPTTTGHLPPTDSTKYTKRGGYWLGFFAAIAVATDNFLLDLNSHSISMSPLFSKVQRFFTVIELANKPFNANVGVAHFSQMSAPLVPARNGIITNGVLGLSSHMGIHGNDNSNIAITDLTIKEFETGGIQFNGASDVQISRIRVGPSLGGPGSTGTVPGSATLSQATLLLNILRGLAIEADPVFQSLQSVVDDFVAGTPNPETDFFTDGAGLPDGSALYGILFHKTGPATHQFAFAHVGQEQRNGDPFDSISITDVVIDGLKLKSDEIVQGVDATFRPVLGPAGDVVQLYRLRSPSGSYSGTALSEAQRRLAELKSQDPSANATELFEKYGSTNIPDSLISWMNGSSSWEDATVGFSFYCNFDPMSHFTKGVVGLRLEFVTNVTLANVSIRNLENVGDRSPNRQYCGSLDEEYLGRDIRGVSIGGGTTLAHNDNGQPRGVTMDTSSFSSNAGAARVFTYVQEGL